MFILQVSPRLVGHLSYSNIYMFNIHMNLYELLLNSLQYVALHHQIVDSGGGPQGLRDEFRALYD